MIRLHYVSEFLKWKVTWDSSQKTNLLYKLVSNEAYLSFYLKIVEVNESRYIATFEVSGSTEKLGFS